MKSTSIRDRLALEMNSCLQGTHVPEWMTKGKTTLIQKDPLAGTSPKQLQTHNLPTDDVENLNTTNKGIDFSTRLQVADCSLRNRKNAAKSPEARESYFT